MYSRTTTAIRYYLHTLGLLALAVGFVGALMFESNLMAYASVVGGLLALLTSRAPLHPRESDEIARLLKERRP